MVALTIRVSSGVGEGRTAVAAYDAALGAMGADHLNLVRVSSIVPPGASVGRQVSLGTVGNVGDLGYCVISTARANAPGVAKWAGLAWANDEAGAGGVFVEATGGDEGQVKAELEESARALLARRGWVADVVETEIAGFTCGRGTSCVVVLALYQAVSWRG